MFTCLKAVLFINCQNAEATKISIGEGINKLWYIHTMEYYSVIKRNELSSHEKIWEEPDMNVA